MTESDPGRRGRAGQRPTWTKGTKLLPVRRCIRVGLLAATLLLPLEALPAQQAPDEARAFRAWPLAQASWKVTKVGDQKASLFGGLVGFGLTPRTVLGGGGFQLSGAASLDAEAEGSRRRLDFGYAGVALQHLRPLAPDWAATGALLLGAGHATVRDRGIELGADNFGILELQVAGVWRGPSPFQVSLSPGYRFASGVQDLPGVSAADLGGLTLTFGLRLAGN